MIHAFILKLCDSHVNPHQELVKFSARHYNFFLSSIFMQISYLNLDRVPNDQANCKLLGNSRGDLVAVWLQEDLDEGWRRSFITAPCSRNNLHLYHVKGYAWDICSSSFGNLSILNLLEDVMLGLQCTELNSQLRVAHGMAVMYTDTFLEGRDFRDR